ncbi:MAG: putative peroxiredoxin [Parasphingorhabdus sp.]
MAGKYLINCAVGKNNAEDATVAFIAAAGATALAEEVVVFLTSDAVRLATPDYADDIQADGYLPLSNFLTDFLANNGKIWVCPACAKARGITRDDVIEGATISGVAAIIEYLENGGKTIM